MSDDLRDRIAAAIADTLTQLRSLTPLPGEELTDCYQLANDVIAIMCDDYINSRGMFHEMDRCLAGESCEEGCNE